MTRMPMTSRQWQLLIDDTLLVLPGGFDSYCKPIEDIESELQNKGSRNEWTRCGFRRFRSLVVWFFDFALKKQIVEAMSLYYRRLPMLQCTQRHTTQHMLTRRVHNGIQT